MERKIIICGGSALIHARYWSWAVCLESEFTQSMKDGGWVESKCINYLTLKQLEFLKSI